MPSNNPTHDAEQSIHSTHSSHSDTPTETPQWLNTLHAQNATDALAEIPNGVVDCIITSPPYWGLRSYDTPNQLGFESDVDAYIDNVYDVFATAKHVLKPSGSVFVVMGDQYQSTAPGTQNTASNLNDKTSAAQAEHYRFDAGIPSKSLQLLPERLAQAFIKDDWRLRSKLIWEKSNPLPEPQASDRFQQSWEYIYFFTHQEQYYFNESYATDTDVWTTATASKDTVHPAPYPTELCKQIIRAACPQDGIVLDPFVGSGTTCIAAKELGRDYIGIDQNKSYLQEAQEQLNATIKLVDDSENNEKTVSLHDSNQQRLDQFTTNST